MSPRRWFLVAVSLAAALGVSGWVVGSNGPEGGWPLRLYYRAGIAPAPGDPGAGEQARSA